MIHGRQAAQLIPRSQLSQLLLQRSSYLLVESQSSDEEINVVDEFPILTMKKMMDALTCR